MTKYRIRETYKDLGLFFYVERKRFIFWKQVKRYVSFERALNHILEQQERNKNGMRDYSITYAPKKGFNWNKSITSSYSSVLKINKL